LNDDDDETINDVDNHDDNYDYDDFKEKLEAYLIN